MPKLWPDNRRVLVVGTTDDYVDQIRVECPGKALFLTLPGIRAASVFSRPDPSEEILSDLSDAPAIRQQVEDHLNRFGIQLAGITCFDCECLALAADLGKLLDLPFHTRSAVENARDKYRSKAIWQEQGVHTPRMAHINTLDDLEAFFLDMKGPVVLKPVCGSGSELVFRCRTIGECMDAFGVLQDGLDRRGGNPLFKTRGRDLMVAEALVAGPEFSCDFIVGASSVSVVRVARKIKYPDHPFGIIAGYQILPDPGAFLDMADLEDTLFRGAKSLGITQGICMADFIRDRLRKNVLVEMTPRPGGDCLPPLLRASAGIDMLSLALDVARGVPVYLPDHIDPLIGVRIFASRGGILKNVDIDDVSEDPRVRSIVLTSRLGRRVMLPPADYDSWILGYMILDPGDGRYPETLSRVITGRVHVEVA